MARKRKGIKDDEDKRSRPILIAEILLLAGGSGATRSNR